MAELSLSITPARVPNAGGDLVYFHLAKPAVNVGGCKSDQLVDGVLRQCDLVRNALADAGVFAPVRGVCVSWTPIGL